MLLKLETLGFYSGSSFPNSKPMGFGGGGGMFGACLLATGGFGLEIGSFFLGVSGFLISGFSSFLSLFKYARLLILPSRSSSLLEGVSESCRNLGFIGFSGSGFFSSILSFF